MAWWSRSGARSRCSPPISPVKRSAATRSAPAPPGSRSAAFPSMPSAPPSRARSTRCSPTTTPIRATTAGSCCARAAWRERCSMAIPPRVPGTSPRPWPDAISPPADPPCCWARPTPTPCSTPHRNPRIPPLRPAPRRRPPDMSTQPHLIIIGNGMVGHHLVEQLVERGATERYAITVFGEERHLAYDRVHLSEVFNGQDAESLALSTADYYAEHGITLRLDEAVTAIDRDASEVVTAEGRTPYDRVVLATGSFPFVPPIPGNDREGCLVYRTLDDLDAIRAAAENAATGVVVGGGLLGLEAANALRGLNLDTAVVEFAPRLMPMQVDTEGGELLREKIESLGVQVLTGRATQEIVDGERSRHRMVFQDEKVLETDLIVFSAGIRPRDELARDCGLELGERGGVVIDDNCLTSDPAILAVGEVALWNNSIFGLVAPGYQMAKAAAVTLLEGNEPFKGADMSTKLKLMGVDVGSIGDAHGDRTPGARQFRFLDPLKQQYRKLVVSSDGKRLVGAMLVGDNSVYDTLLQYYANRIELPEDPATLILPAGR